MAPVKELKCIRPDSLQQLCRYFEWSEKVSGFITPHATVSTVFNSLVNHRYWFDAATLLAHALPKKEAILWTSLVVGDYFMFAPSESLSVEKTALESIRQWLNNPEDGLRLAAHAAGQRVGNRLPSYWAAMAVFWSMGNITPEVGVITPPPPFLYARAVAACIDMAASLDGRNRESNYVKWLKLGLFVANGDNPSKIVEEFARKKG